MLKLTWLLTFANIRGALDDYIDEAEDEIRGYDSGVHALTQYEKCSVDFQSLLAVYKQTMAASDRSHRALKTTWRHVSNLLGRFFAETVTKALKLLKAGELASHIVDGEAFDTFLQQEGCEGSVADGGLTEQTLQQVRDASAGMRMLYDRFEVADLASPDLKTVEDAVERIKASFSEATERVCKIRGEIPNWFLPHIDLVARLLQSFESSLRYSEKDQKQMDSEIALLEEAR
ncbi:unnamed protein product [Symbiodinium microadriaticum]|nr:unnamed protein product [Symbiodinium microadriaticum]